jgi:ABC-type dipeptide/oligopeptide/nickel transport system permease component
MPDELTTPQYDEKKKRLVDLLEPLAVAYMYVLAVLSPVLGLILGIVAIKKCELEKNKRLAKIVIIVSIVMLGVWSLCVAAYVVFVVAMMAKTGGAASGGKLF